MAGFVYVDLMLENGELVRIECPDKFEDQLHDTLNFAMKRGDTWSAVQFDGCNAEYMGILIEKVNMKKVVAEL